MDFRPTAKSSKGGRALASSLHFLFHLQHIFLFPFSSHLLPPRKSNVPPPPLLSLSGGLRDLPGGEGTSPHLLQQQHNSLPPFLAREPIVALISPLPLQKGKRPEAAAKKPPLTGKGRKGRKPGKQLLFSHFPPPTAPQKPRPTCNGGGGGEVSAHFTPPSSVCNPKLAGPPPTNFQSRHPPIPDLKEDLRTPHFLALPPM